MIACELLPCPVCHGLAREWEETSDGYGTTGPMFTGCRNHECPEQPKVWSKSKAFRRIAWTAIADDHRTADDDFTPGNY